MMHLCCASRIAIRAAVLACDWLQAVELHVAVERRCSRDCETASERRALHARDYAVLSVWLVAGGLERRALARGQVAAVTRTSDQSVNVAAYTLTIDGKTRGLSRAASAGTRVRTDTSSNVSRRQARVT
jgi:hypothetical protein